MNRRVQLVILIVTVACWCGVLSSRWEGTTQRDAVGAHPTVTPQQLSGQAAAGATTALRQAQTAVGPATQYKVRDPGEWSGMLIDLRESVICETPEHCQLARGCVAGACTACSTDATCTKDELCVLDHCVRSELVACHNSKDCEPPQLCVLTGYSNDPRGNADMRAACSGDLNAPARQKPIVSRAEPNGRKIAFDAEFERARALRAKN